MRAADAIDSLPTYSLVRRALCGPATRIRTQGLDVPIPEELEDVDADTLEALCDRLYEAREQSLARLGEVQSGVLSRTTPALVDGTMIPPGIPAQPARR